MTDRELLEKAAKAAGLTVDPNTQSAKHWTVRNERGDLFDWNPLTDDGDALRLAVKLNLPTEWGDGFADAGPCREWFAVRAGEEATLEQRLAATRLAIVRAAAEMAGI